ncbi:unnamed protein product [Cyprideis torosa]|uniref:DNA replication complex GINS protein PSF1 n=1 Tax=Cyprideis torosa TaxID=163714 RepID=A0A7R8WM17_9CRUS|nr:unnamed protein product [Cyprideis torosa]CAG0904851.1 unnamed protein product [Cyprideis torosa]
MFTERAVELLKELNRSGSSLPAFNEESVRRILEECRQLFEANQADVARTVEEGAAAFMPAVHLRHSCLERNRRCLLTYLTTRLSLIRRHRWEFASSILPEDIRANLCEPETKWLQNYSRSLAQYMASIGGASGLDLTQDLQPPKSVFVEVRCVQEYGEYQLESTGDMVLLRRNSTHLLPRGEAEPLIRQGILEHVR